MLVCRKILSQKKSVVQASADFFEHLGSLISIHLQPVSQFGIMNCQDKSCNMSSRTIIWILGDEANVKPVLSVSEIRI